MGVDFDDLDLVAIMRGLPSLDARPSPDGSATPSSYGDRSIEDAMGWGSGERYSL